MGYHNAYPLFEASIMDTTGSSVYRYLKRVLTVHHFFTKDVFFFRYGQKSWPDHGENFYYVPRPLEQLYAWLLLSLGRLYAKLYWFCNHLVLHLGIFNIL